MIQLNAECVGSNSHHHPRDDNASGITQGTSSIPRHLRWPLLGRLLEEGLIEEHENGRYRITKKGVSIASDIKSAHNIMQKHLEVMFRIGNMGRFMTMDLIDRISAIGSTLSSNLDRMTEEEKNKYKDFLVNELQKLNNQENIQVADRKIDDKTII